MKTRMFLSLFLLFWLALAAGPAAAENLANAFTLSPMVGGQVFEGGNRGLDDDMAVGLGFGYNYNANWGTELFLTFSPAEGGDGSEDVDVFTYSLNGLYHLLPNGPLVPYLTLGAGAITYDPDDHSETNFAVNYGGGLKWFFNDRIALRGDVRHLIGFDQGVDEWSHTDHNLIATAGLTFQFGAPAPAPAPVREPEAKPAPAPAAPADRDGDGVPDSRDKCPDTPKGVAVDERGCPKDSDGDGVPDYLDKCPDTPKGVAVDEKGCPRDSDQDGVPDDRDKCPDTPRGVMVDEKGCPLSLEIHIEFDFDKAEIKPEFHGELQKAADFIREHPAPKILIAGHTDSVGTVEYNKELSERRAAAVRQFLIERHGVDANTLVSRGYGESRPVATNETDEGRQRNRRTEIVCCVFIPEE